MNDELPGKSLPPLRERGDLDDPSKVKRKEIQGRLGRRQQLEDVSWVLSTTQGRRFFWRLLTQGKIYESCFTGNNTTFWNEGRRDLANEFLADTQWFPQLYLRMIDENRVTEEVPK